VRLDYQTAIDVTDGADRRVIEPRDGQTEITPEVILTAPIMRKTRPNPSTTDPQKESFLSYTDITRTNQAALNSTMAVLAPGLWDLEYSLATWTNFTNVAGSFLYTNINALFILPVSGLTLLAHYAVIGAQSTHGRIRLNLQNNTTIRHSVPITGVGQSIDTTAMLCGTRIF